MTFICYPKCTTCQKARAWLDEHPEYKFGKVNVDEQPELAGQFRIMSIPTLMVFRGGQAAAVKVGVTPKEELLKLLG
jgi:thioredoxin 1